MPNFSRRDWFRISTAASLTAGLPWFDALRSYAEEAAATGRPRPAKQVILLWLGGGPSQAHSFDPRPGEHVELIKTNVVGVQFSEYLPRLAQQMNRLVLLKTMNHPNFGHGDAVIWMQTGFKNRSGGVERPSLGSIVSKAVGSSAAELPNYVVIDPSGAEGIFSINGGHLGPAYNPLKVYAGETIPNLKPTGETTLDDVLARAKLVEQMNRAFIAHHHAGPALGHDNSLQQALKIMQTAKTKAFDLGAEPAAVQDRYGRDKMGRACLLARRLIEAEVPFVAAHLNDGMGNGWDTHMDAPDRNKILFQNLDVCFSALLDDLAERGRLDSTLVICMGEFGRSRNGVEHNNKMWTAVLAGGGLRTGQVIGDTGDDGRTLSDYGPISPGDLFATVLCAMGLDHKAEYIARGGRPVEIVDKSARPIERIL